jgi:hypothetical protein
VIADDSTEFFTIFLRLSITIEFVVAFVLVKALYHKGFKESLSQYQQEQEKFEYHPIAYNYYRI